MLVAAAWAYPQCAGPASAVAHDLMPTPRFGGVLLLGLEILVAADLVRTVAVEPTLENVAILGLIVLIRTFLSFSLEIEIEGLPPWRRALVGGGRFVSEALSRAQNATDSTPRK